MDARVVAQFLANACPDHHVRDGGCHWAVRGTAENMLRRMPELATENLFTAIVCGEIAEVERILRERPAAATEAGGPKDLPRRRAHTSFSSPHRRARRIGSRCTISASRGSMSPSNDNAVAVARLFLDRGANPNAFFFAGSSHYTPLTGVIGAGEEGRPAHPPQDELTQLLLERGADPFDVQVFYNIHFRRDVLRYLRAAYDFTVAKGRKADWDDPEWRMIDMGGYGGGARWLLGDALEHDDLESRRVMLSHGASPNPALPPKRRGRRDSSSAWAAAMANGTGCRGTPRPLRRNARTARAGRRVRLPRGMSAHGSRGRQRDPHATSRVPHAAARTPSGRTARTRERRFLPARSRRADQVEVAKRMRPLHVAAWHNARNVAKLLIERGAEVDPRETEWGNTPLDFAVHFGLTMMIDLLAPHSRDIWNLVFTGQVDRVHAVLDADPSLARVVTDDGATPLTWLPVDQARALDIIRQFRARGADVSVRYQGLTPAERARKRWMLEAAEALA